MRPIAAIFGPTAAGKSELALAVAELAGGEIVSADSMQCYRGLPVLTNQPTPAERARVPHRCTGIWELSERSSVGEYAPLAHAAIDGAAAAGRAVVVAGGTGLYLRAALAELRLPPPVPPELRSRYERLYDERGGEGALAELAARDPAAAAVLHPNDRRRVVRALELAAVGASLRADDDRLWSADLRRPALVFTLSWEREALRERIARRSAAMLAAGALDEVAAVIASGLEPSPTAARIVGLAEVAEHLRGGIDRSECARRIALRTGQYARRQEVWMRKIPDRIALAGADGAARNAQRVLERISA